MLLAASGFSAFFQSWVNEIFLLICSILFAHHKIPPEEVKDKDAKEWRWWNLARWSAVIAFVLVSFISIFLRLR